MLLGGSTPLQRRKLCLDNHGCWCMDTMSENVTTGDVRLELGSLANWDFSNVTTFRGMFFGYNSTLTDADSINSINNLDVSNATNLSNMFGYGNSVMQLVDLSNWNVSNATNMESMFRNCTTI